MALILEVHAYSSRVLNHNSTIRNVHFHFMTLAQSMVHTLDPFAWQLSDAFGIRWYGLAYLTGFVVAWLILKWLSSTGRVLIRPNQVADFFTWLIVGVLVGGRLGYVLLYSPDLLWTFSGAFPFWGVLEIHKGGMASHGGMIGVIVASIFFARKAAVPAWHVLDITAFLAPPGLGLGRVANFVNGELWGKPLPKSMHAQPPWWSVKYPDELTIDTFPRGPEVDVLIPMVQVTPTETGRLALRDAAYAGRTDVVDAIAPYLTPYYPSQLFQAASDGAVLLMALILVWLMPRKPGIITGAFLVVYGLLRILTEQFRAQFTTNWGYSSMLVAAGLSGVMVIIGCSVLAYCGTRPNPRIGGLLRPMNTG